MLLAVDIGNTSIKFGLFDGDDLVSTHIIATKRTLTSEEIKTAIGDWLPTGLTSSIFSSVVPELDEATAQYLGEVTKSSLKVKTNDDFGLTFRAPVNEAGTDRLVNAFAAAEIYGVPCVVIGFGTATTIDVVSRERELLGGLIAPGPATTAKALELGASKLPEVEVAEPPSVIATDTVHAIQAGIFYSQVGLVERALPDIKQEVGDDARVVATGGFASLIADKCLGIDIVDRDLTLKGLNLLRHRLSRQPA
jgi:type III pantothenate kinase